jgi:hypothetical protein
MDKNEASEKGKKPTTKSENDGANTPVPDTSVVRIVSKSEAELIRQAKNSLGAPDKVY